MDKEKIKSREKILEELKTAEMEEGRTGLVTEYLLTHPPEDAKIDEKPEIAEKTIKDKKKRGR